MGNIFNEPASHVVHDELRIGTFHLEEWVVIRDALRHYVITNEHLHDTANASAANAIQKDIDFFILEHHND